MVARSRGVDLTTGEGLDEALAGVEARHRSRSRAAPRRGVRRRSRRRESTVRTGGDLTPGRPEGPGRGNGGALGEGADPSRRQGYRARPTPPTTRSSGRRRPSPATIGPLPAGVGGEALTARTRHHQLPAAAAAGDRPRVHPTALGELEATRVTGSSRPAGAAEVGVAVGRHESARYRRARGDQRLVGTIAGVTGPVPVKLADDAPREEGHQKSCLSRGPRITRARPEESDLAPRLTTVSRHSRLGLLA